MAAIGHVMDEHGVGHWLFVVVFFTGCGHVIVTGFFTGCGHVIVTRFFTGCVWSCDCNRFLHWLCVVM